MSATLSFGRVVAAEVRGLTEMLLAGSAARRDASPPRSCRRRRIVVPSQRTAHSIGGDAGAKNLARHLRRFGAPPVSVRRPERFLHAAARRRLAQVDGGVA